MPKPTPEQMLELQRKIQAAIPGWQLNHLTQRHGRWIAHLINGDEIDISQSLDLQAYINQAIMNPPMLPEWRRKLTDKTAAEVEAMCRRLLQGNPNNKFVRDQYPQIFAEITDGQREQTTHREPSHAA